MKGKAVPLVVLVVALAALAGTVAYAIDRAGGDGPMSRSGYWMMDGSGQRTAWYLDGSGSVRDIAAARARAQRFADRAGLTTAEVMRFANNFYVRLDDRQGDPAAEVLVDPRSGDVALEYGAAMMWNTHYGAMTGSGRLSGVGAGMMGRRGGGMLGPARGAGMMGRWGGMLGAAGGGPVDARGARAIADRWLASHRLAATAGEPDAFPGYFTMETRHAGKIAGMVSVNARTGALIYHWWHGRFIASEE